VVLGL